MNVSQNGTDGRVYGGDDVLIHVKDGTRAAMGRRMAFNLDTLMREKAFGDGMRTHAQAWGDAEQEEQLLCPGCYMVVGFDMLVALAQQNGQSLRELGSTMAEAFSHLANNEWKHGPMDNGSVMREEIDVILDPCEA